MPDALLTPETLLTPSEASEYLKDRWGCQLKRNTLDKLRVIGGGPVFRKFGRQVRYSAHRLDEFAASRISTEFRSTSDPVMPRRSREDQPEPPPPAE